MKRFITIMLVLCFLVTPITTIASDEIYYYPLGDGSYVASINQSAGEWIVAFYYWLQDVGVAPGGDESCDHYGL